MRIGQLWGARQWRGLASLPQPHLPTARCQAGGQGLCPKPKALVLGCLMLGASPCCHPWPSGKVVHLLSE